MVQGAHADLFIPEIRRILQRCEKWIKKNWNITKWPKIGDPNVTVYRGLVLDKIFTDMFAFHQPFEDFNKNRQMFILFCSFLSFSDTSGQVLTKVYLKSCRAISYALSIYLSIYERLNISFCTGTGSRLDVGFLRPKIKLFSDGIFCM